MYIYIQIYESVREVLLHTYTDNIGFTVYIIYTVYYIYNIHSKTSKLTEDGTDFT